MTHEEYGWTTFDGIPIHARTWKPQGTARAVIALVHGLGDHSGRYPWLVEALTAAGYAVSAFDRRGEGKSGGPRTHAPSYEALMQDIDRHLENTRSRFSGLPVVLYGHSFGGQQTLCYVMQRSPRVAGVVASSPALASGVRQAAVKLMAGRVMAKVLPGVRFPVGAPLGSLSHDPAWLATTRADPYFTESVSARLGILLVDRGQWVASQSEFPPVPLLIMQGTEDKHVDPAVNVEFARRLMAARTPASGRAAEVTLKVWEGLGHELHNETESSRAEVLAFVRGWLDQKVR